MFVSCHTVSSPDILSWLVLHEKKKRRNTNFVFYVRHTVTDVVMLGERKCTSKCEPRMLLSAIPKKIPLFRERTWGNRKDLLPEWSKCRTDIPCLPQKPWITARSVHCQSCTGLDSQICCTCNRPRSWRPSIPYETASEVHKTIHTVSAPGISCVLYLPNSTVRKTLCSVVNVFPFQFQRVQMLKTGENQLRLDFC